MEVRFTPDVQEQLSRSTANRGCDAAQLVQNVPSRYLADEGRLADYFGAWTDAERQAAVRHVEAGFLEAERGELIDGTQARREIQAMKEAWKSRRLPRG